MEDRNKKYVAGAVVLLIGLISVLALSNGGSEDPAGNWQQFELKDVSTGENYSISELEKPVLVETFAVWCPTCTRQQQEVKNFHEESGVNSVSLDVDPNEDEAKVRQHIERHGFDWRYSIAPPEMTRSLIQEYGNSIANPPVAPMVLVCENRTRRLPNGVKPVSKLEEEVDKGC